MAILLDTHVLLAVLRDDGFERFPQFATVLVDPRQPKHASVASIWEIAIKTKLGKLNPGVPVGEIGEAIRVSGLVTVDIVASHATAEFDPLPATRDPFDKLCSASARSRDFGY